MTLDLEECWARLRGAAHGVLSTRHPRRGVDAVPVVFAVVDSVIVVPVDTVKPKRALTLQRQANLARDPRCVLLVEHYEDDWSQLWWVRAHAEATPTADPSMWVDALAAKYPDYRSPGAVVGALALRPTAINGWAASRR